jgi:hypothetical protein
MHMNYNKTYKRYAGEDNLQHMKEEEEERMETLMLRSNSITL